jgi:hypothetical protein
VYVVEDYARVEATPGRVAAHADHKAAQHAAVLLVGRYVINGYRVVERLRDGESWFRWVLRHDRKARWAAVELREERPPSSGDPEAVRRWGHR